MNPSSAPHSLLSLAFEQVNIFCWLPCGGPRAVFVRDSIPAVHAPFTDLSRPDFLLLTRGPNAARRRSSPLAFSAVDHIICPQPPLLRLHRRRSFLRRRLTSPPQPPPPIPKRQPTLHLPSLKRQSPPHLRRRKKWLPQRRRTATRCSRRGSRASGSGSCGSRRRGTASRWSVSLDRAVGYRDVARGKSTGWGDWRSGELLLVWRRAGEGSGKFAQLGRVRYSMAAFRE